MMVDLKLVGNKIKIEDILNQIKEKYEILKLHDYKVDDQGRGFFIKVAVEVPE
jgi:hypothetical protein